VIQFGDSILGPGLSYSYIVTVSRRGRGEERRVKVFEFILFCFTLLLLNIFYFTLLYIILLYFILLYFIFSLF
jgi:hypothetical protein